MGHALIDVGFSFTGIVLISGIHKQSFKRNFFHALLILSHEPCSWL